MGQFNALLYKNYSMNLKSKGSLCCQIVTPVVCLILVFVLKIAIKSEADDDDNNIRNIAYLNNVYLANNKYIHYPNMNLPETCVEFWRFGASDRKTLG